MDINQLVKSIKTPLSEKDLIRVCDLTDAELRKYELQLKVPNREGMQRIADFLERDVCHLYIAIKGMHPLVYWDCAVYVEILAYDDFFLKQFQVKEMVDQQYKSVERVMKEDNSKLGALMYLCNGNARYLVFKYIYDKLPNDKKYEFFKDLYVSSEYGFRMFTDDFIEDVMKHKSKNNLRELAKKVGNVHEGWVTIFRGQGSESTPAEHAWSWTTNLNTAIWFATRFDMGGKVMTGKVQLEDIIDFINDRNEFEVFVNPKDVHEVSEYPMMDFEALLPELEEYGIIDQYHNYRVYIDDDSYMEPKGIHGVRHAKRVLLLSLVLCHYEGISEEETEIVAWASVLHDIGREHDDEDERHGELSWEKVMDDDLVPGDFDEEDTEVLHYIIDQHCVDDKQAFKNVEKYDISNQIRAINLLKVFKDADGLDRVRLKDLDPKYLRTDTSKKMILLANQFLRGIK